MENETKTFTDTSQYNLNNCDSQTISYHDPDNTCSGPDTKIIDIRIGIVGMARTGISTFKFLLKNMNFVLLSRKAERIQAHSLDNVDIKSEQNNVCAIRVVEVLVYDNIYDYKKIEKQCLNQHYKETEGPRSDQHHKETKAQHSLEKNDQKNTTEKNEIKKNEKEHDFVNYYVSLEEVDRWNSVDYIVVSPGIPRSHDVFQLVPPKISDCELHYILNPNCEYISITGTNAKSTTASRVAHMLGLEAVGNIGKPIFEECIKKKEVKEPDKIAKHDSNSVLSQGDNSQEENSQEENAKRDNKEENNERLSLNCFLASKDTVAATHKILKPMNLKIIEISSFQLDLQHEFRPRIAALLNIKEDHLDRYKDMNEYINSKMKIFENMKFKNPSGWGPSDWGPSDWGIINLNDDLLFGLYKEGRFKDLKCNLIGLNLKRKNDGENIYFHENIYFYPELELLNKSSEDSKLETKCNSGFRAISHLFWKLYNEVINKVLKNSDMRTVSNLKTNLDFKTSAINFPNLDIFANRYDCINAAFSVLITCIARYLNLYSFIDSSDDGHFETLDLSDRFLNWPGLEFCAQVISKIDKIIFINDSKGTNPNSTAKVLSSLENVYLIAGGIFKSEAGSLKEILELKNRVACVYLYGRDKKEMNEMLKNDFKCVICENLDDAFESSVFDANTWVNDQDVGNNQNVGNNQFEINNSVRKITDSEAVVLLSPMCSSLDQFKSFKERGLRFNHLVSQYISSLDV